MGSLGRMDGRMDARCVDDDDGTGRVDDDGRVTLTRTRYVYTSVDLGLVHFRASERASELDDDDAMTIAVRWRRMDGWTKAMRAVYPSISSIHRSIHDRSIDG